MDEALFQRHLSVLNLITFLSAPLQWALDTLI